MQLADYDYEPIATAYLAYPAGDTVSCPMLGPAGPVRQWVFDRGQAGGNDGVFAFVLSAEGKVGRTRRRRTLPAPAANSSRPPARCRRPLAARHPRTARHLLLPATAATTRTTDDPARPGWPATTWETIPAALEGAVRSGVAAARDCSTTVVLDDRGLDDRRAIRATGTCRCQPAARHRQSAGS